MNDYWNTKAQLNYLVEMMKSFQLTAVGAYSDGKETYTIFDNALPPNKFASLVAHILDTYANVSGIDTKTLLAAIQIDLIPKEEFFAKLKTLPKKAKAPKKRQKA